MGRFGREKDRNLRNSTENQRVREIEREIEREKETENLPMLS